MKRSRQTCAVVLGLVLATCGTALAEETAAQLGEMVVTATRDEVPIEQVGSSITVITAKEIEQQQVRTVADALRTVPGLDVVTSGGLGQTSSVFMRGANSNHTLILIDGVEMGDPSSTGGGYDLANLTTDNIKQIEVLRGPQSTLYGSKAIGGVINITTKQGEGKPTGFVSAEGGSFYTARETAAINGGTNLLHYALTASRVDTNGISSAASRYGNVLNNGYQNSTISTRLGITPNKDAEIDMSLRYTRAKASLDNGGGAGQDDPNNFLKTDELQFRTQGTLSLFKDLWEQTLGVSFHDLTRSNDNGWDIANAAKPYLTFNSEYHGQSVKVDWQHTVRLHETNTAVLGIETTEENAKSSYSDLTGYNSVWDEKFARTTGSYLQDQISLWDTWFTTLGVRVDDHSQFGTEATYRFTTAYLLKQTSTKLKGSYGTGFKAPSLFQLYAAGGFVQGNSNLLPEKSTGWDLGIEQSLADKRLNIGATYFHNDFDQLIEGYTVPVTYVYTYRNIAKAESTGVELTASYQPLNELMFHAAYTYTQTKDKENGQELTRRPKNKLTGDVNYRFLDKGNLNLGFVYVGTRNDLAYDPVTYTSHTVKLKDYLLVNLAGSYDVSKNLQLFGRIDNLFDRQYEEVAGYGTPGIGAYAGVKVSF